MTTMNTGDVTRRLGIVVTTELIHSLGIKPVGQDKRATLWAQDDYPKICKALSKFIAAKVDVPMQPKPERKEKVPKGAAVSAPAVDEDDEEL